MILVLATSKGVVSPAANEPAKLPQVAPSNGEHVGGFEIFPERKLDHRKRHFPSDCAQIAPIEAVQAVLLQDLSANTSDFDAVGSL
ncbi:hypothetical protein WR25_23408 [Diploscapter pachys]|uniref:Uncharacterized protein n=1 Tax=Diploscapter pachys TaxID=2018661 RepID=A0A2A2JM40_9BILA|nr:hypothetical protein WR25_23408 [Diploscapter pachys]